MDTSEVVYFSQIALRLVFDLSLPVIVVATAVGLIIAVLQTLLQVQEQTLAFGAKLFAVLFVLGLLMPWMSGELLQLLNNGFTAIGGNRSL